MSIRSALKGSVLAAVVLLATACSQPSTQPAAPVASSVPPTLSPSPPTAQDCNRRASLRPQGPLPVPGRMPTGSTMDHIVQRGFLKAGINQDTYQFSFRDENLRLQGFDVDIIRDIAEAIFGNREQVVFRPLNGSDRVNSAKSGDVDLVAATVTITCARQKEVNFSTVYYEAAQRILVNRGSGITGLDDLRGKRVCAPRGSTTIEKISTFPSKPIPVGVATSTDCLMLLQLGKIDAVSSDDTLLASMAAQDPQTEVIGPRLSEEPYGIATNKSTPDLVRFVNSVLERRAADGRWRASYKHWLTLLLGPAPSPPAPQYQD